MIYAKWSRTAEKRLATTEGTDNEESHNNQEAETGYGRGTPPRFHLKPVVQAVPKGAEQKDFECMGLGKCGSPT